MRRIRLFFVALAVLLLVPMVLLVRGALRSAAYETQARYRAIAERAGDELERELSALVQKEDSRPFGHYRFYYVPPNVAGGRYAVTRSPLADSALPPYVIGYFELQPDGSIRSPRVPRDTELARQRRDWDPAEADDSIAKVRDIVGVAAARARRARQGVAGLQAPGTTRLMPGADADLAAEPDAAPHAQEALEALLALNRGAGERARGDPNLLNIQLTPLEDGSGFRVVARVGDREEPVAEKDLRIGAATGREEIWFEPSEVLHDQVPRPRTVHIHPTSGQLVDPGHLMLLRAAATESQWFWQGVLIDLPAFTKWLDQSVFGRSEVARRMRRDYFVAGGEEPPPLDEPGSVWFVYRFARPFDSVAVRMVLSPFSDLAGTTWVYVLALLVLLTGSAGLYALYRMVEVTVGFAERRSNFAAAVSHELKTPLTAIRMYAEMLRDGMVSSEQKQREYADTITTESERLSRLINNVLEFSRLEQGTRDVRLVAGSLGGVVEEAARILEPHARQAGFELEVKVDEGLPPVRYDRDAVLQVVFNLVDNALKYARDARDRRVVLRCRAAEGGVRLSVRDNGPGVPAQHLSRIFEAFYRGGDELTRTSKGTGIGLALVRGLAERMGAVVTGSNPEGGGFEVVLRFPAAA